ncbi:MAG: hypothetical protein NVS2B12_32330 [Ktedonobacteraceae bacterium]
MDSRKVEILNARPGISGEELRYVKDGTQYFLPMEVDEQARASREAAIKYIAKQDQMSQPGFNEEAFEAAWPALLTSFYRTPSQRESPNTPVIAIVDTGLLHDHPFIKDCIIAEKDFTGEGPEDLNGHGTISALITRIVSPYFKPKFVNVKAAGKDGYGSPEHLVAGLRYLVQYKQEHPQERLLANLSLGVYSMKWGGLFNCQGDCEVCRAAVEVASHDIFLTIAAGNEPGIPTCPAKVGLMKKYSSLPILAVTTYDFHAARGSIAAPGTFQFSPLNT